MAYLAQKGIGAVHANVDYQFRFENALVAYWQYICKTFWPQELIPIYSRHPWSGAIVAWASAVLIIVSVLAIRSRRRHPYLWVGWCWFLGNLLPSIGIVPIGEHAMADRYTYLPLIGIFIMLAWGIAELISRLTSPSSPVIASVFTCTAFVFVALPLCTLRQMAYWKDGVTLFTHAVETDPSGARAHSVLAANLLAEHEYDLALVHANESLRLDPKSADCLALLGGLCSVGGRPAEAKTYYEKALALSPKHRQALFGLARLLSTLENPNMRNASLAIAVAERLCAATGDRYPKHIGILGCAYAAAGRFEEAIAATEKALSLARQIREAPSVADLTKQLALFQQRKAVFVTPDLVPSVNDGRVTK